MPGVGGSILKARFQSGGAGVGPRRVKTQEGRQRGPDDAGPGANGQAVPGVTALSLEHVVKRLQQESDLARVVGAGLAKFGERLAGQRGPGGGQAIEPIQRVLEGGVILAAVGGTGPLHQRGEIIRLHLQNLLHEPLIFGVAVAAPLLADGFRQGIKRSQVARLILDRLAQVSDGFRQSALLFGQDAQQGLDGAAFRGQSMGSLEVRRRRLQVVLAQLQQPEIGPPGRLPRNQFHGPIQVLAGKILPSGFEGCHANLERTLIFLIQRRTASRAAWPQDQ